MSLWFFLSVWSVPNKPTQSKVNAAFRWYRKEWHLFQIIFEFWTQKSQYTSVFGGRFWLLMVIREWTSSCDTYVPYISLVTWMQHQPDLLIFDPFPDRLIQSSYTPSVISTLPSHLPLCPPPLPPPLLHVHERRGVSFSLGRCLLQAWDQGCSIWVGAWSDKAVFISVISD